MNIYKILSKVYGSSSMIIGPVVLLLCIACKWPLIMIVAAMFASICISSPAMISLHLMLWLFKARALETVFVWMIVLALIPLLSFIAAFLFADFVPGKIWFLLLLGVTSGYFGLLRHGISVSQFFNSTEYERKENNTID